MAEQFGLKVILELAIGNLQSAVAKVQSAFKNITISGGGGTKPSGGSGGGDGDEEKKGNGFLAGILTKVAAIAALVLAAKPVQDLIKIFVGFAILGFLTIFKWLGKLLDATVGVASATWSFFQPGVQSIIDAFKVVGDVLTGNFSGLKDDLAKLGTDFGQYIQNWINLLEPLWQPVADFLKNIWDSIVAIWPILEGIPGKIWDFIQQGYNWVVDKLSQVGDFLGGFLKSIPERIIALKDGIVSLWNTFVSKLSDLRAAIGTFLGSLIDDGRKLLQYIIDLPGKIWDYMKALPELIASAIVRFIEGMISSLGSVDDAIITKGGKVIRTNPEDNIYAFKGDQVPGGGGGGGGGQTNIYFYGVTEDDFIQKLKSILGVDVLGSGSRF